MRIGVDIDGVLYGWTEHARWLLAFHHGYDLGESTSWFYLRDHIAPEHWRWLWNEGVTEHGLFRYGTTYPGSVEAMNLLARLGRVAIITHRPEAGRVDTLDWLAYNRVPAHEVHLLTGAEPKSSVVPRCDVYIDDSPGVIADLVAHAAPAMVLVPDRTWNREVSETPRVKRMADWLAVIREVRRLRILEPPPPPPLLAERRWR